MLIQQILTPDRTLYGSAGVSKKRVLETIAHFIGEQTPTLNSDEIFSALINREKLGSTGLGGGIAIPHCRISNCHTVVGTLVRLPEPVDFDSIDEQPVDLVFTLLVPEEATDEHLQTLSTLASRFSDPDYCDRLRAADSNMGLYEAAISMDELPEGQRRSG